MGSVNSRKNTWITVLIIATAFAVVGLTAFFGRAGFDLKARENQFSEPTLSRGDILRVNTPTFMPDSTVPVDFYDESTGSLKECALPHGAQLIYFGSYKQYVVATVGKNSQSHCAQNTPIVIPTETATQWRQGYLSEQIRQRAEEMKTQERLSVEQQKRRDTIRAAEEILKNR